MSNTSLSLYPINPEFELEESLLIEALRKIGFIGQACSHARSKEDWFFTGGQFPDYFLLMGHPLQVENSFLHTHAGSILYSALTQGQPACLIQVKVSPTIGVIASRYTADVQPRCSVCSHEHQGNWSDLIDQWWKHQAEYRYVCPQCSTELKLWELNWQEVAGFCQIEISILDFYRPAFTIQPSLWEALHRETGVRWTSVWCKF